MWNFGSMSNKFNLDGVFQEVHFQKRNGIHDINNDNDEIFVTYCLL